VTTPTQSPSHSGLPEGGPSGPHEPREGGLSKGVQLSVAAVLVAALLGWYGYTNLGEGTSFTYYHTLDELIAAGVAPGSNGLRVHGFVSTESIQRDLEGRRVRFVVQNDPPHRSPGAGGDRLTVVYNSLETPDLFKDGAEVVVEGRLEGSDAGTVFVADNVMAKCPSKFQAEVAGGASPPDAQAL
jgi:cytochrome c-type biogenesis protein CcmE